MILRLYKLVAIFLLFSGCLNADAAPNDDLLGQFIQDKQQEKSYQNSPARDEEGFDRLITQRALGGYENTRSTQQATNNREDADELISSAMGFLGVAYRFGGTSPTGFDCSGFMQYIFRKAFAVNLPRTSVEQASVGTYVSRENLQPGDMVFFRTMGARISHVGMYIGNDRFIHAPRTGKHIEITSLSHKYWNSKYATARRVKRNNAQDFIRN